ncbi:hypothetical protein CROQUDRAFT_106465 [Cronartium quercuum f. sp. fusiforme G11]|uniref:Peroxisomal ATPase PEX6 n=1 Tax=Cronartium quercuum f. sp. fusiforme G11 TaxID=708437 RepID=A0A9P6TD34_9BASI|nr:hypothetical protein CROQUDRAFT_106465 [Cronartium quercuum f. sp. fusiforme G11]
MRLIQLKPTRSDICSQSIKVSIEFWNSIFKSDNNNYHFVSLYPPDRFHSSPPLILKLEYDNRSLILPPFECPTWVYDHFNFNLNYLNPIQLEFNPIQLISLQSVILQANNSESFQFAQSNPNQLRHQLSNLIILRSNFYYHHQQLYSFQIILTNPVNQGTFDLHSTLLTLLAPHSQTQTQSQIQLEIEPDFLAQSTLTTTLHHSLLRPFPHPTILDPIHAIVRTPSLTSLGVCTSDWVFLAPSASDPPIRVLCLSNTDDPSLPLDGLWLSPLLLHAHPHPSFVLTPANPPLFPIIRSLTLARLPSPHPALKQLQPVFLTALARHFRQKSRILKLGDLVPVPIDPRLARFVEPSESPEDLELQLGPPQTVIYFKVTQLEVLPEENANLGARLDPATTKLIQTGLAPSTLVPDLSHALGLPGLPPSAPTKLEQTLSDIFAATLARPKLPRTILLNGPRGVGKATAVARATAAAGFQLCEISAFSLLADSEPRTAAAIESTLERAHAAAPVVLLIRHVEALGRRSQTVEDGGREPATVRVFANALKSLSEQVVMVVGTTTDREKLSPALESLFKRSLELLAPTSEARDTILNNLFARDNLGPGVAQLLHSGTASLVAKDLVAIATYSRAAAVRRTLSSRTTVSDIAGAGGVVLCTQDVSHALARARTAYTASLGAPTIPDVRWEDIGGLSSVREAVLETLTLPLSRPELFATGLRRRSGILLFGPPGTGKTLVAKAVATSVGLNFISVKGPELLDMYIGESESKVRGVFERARSSKPCVIFFDELDSLAPRRGNQSDSGGVMDRIVSQLLAELDSIGEQVYVLGATNRPDLLEPALLRPGRFEKLVYLGGLPNGKARVEVVKALTRKMKLALDVDLAEVVDSLAKGVVVTGADLYSVCAEGMTRAMTKLATRAEEKAIEAGTSVGVWLEKHRDELELVIGQEELLGAAKDWVGSVSEAEMEHYRAAQIKFTREGCLLGSADVNSSSLIPIVNGLKGKGKGKAIYEDE